jgi:hypothetical protein
MTAYHPGARLTVTLGVRESWLVYGRAEALGMGVDEVVSACIYRCIENGGPGMEFDVYGAPEATGWQTNEHNPKT